MRLGTKGFLEGDGFEMGKFKSLGDVILNYTYVLIDTCAFQASCNDEVPESVEKKLENYLMQQEPHKLQRKEMEFLEKIRDCLIQKESIEFWKKKLKYFRNCYTIPEVIEEMEKPGHYSYTERVKRQSVKKIPYLTELRREIRELNTKGNSLIKSLEEGKRIYQFDREEQNQYDKSYEEHFELETGYGLHRADFPLLISGKVITQTKGSCAIISNDFGIVRAWDALLKKEGFSRNRFGFIVRRGVSLFEKL